VPPNVLFIIFASWHLLKITIRYYTIEILNFKAKYFWGLGIGHWALGIGYRIFLHRKQEGSFPAPTTNTL
jgi:hypothetical protein